MNCLDNATQVAYLLACTAADIKRAAEKKKNAETNSAAKKKVAKSSNAKSKSAEPAKVDPEFETKVARIKTVGEECISEPELRKLLAGKPDTFRLYDGFEPSGRMHIAQGIFKALNVNKCTKSGGTFVFWVADWFALMNDKMGGDLDKIITVGKYLIEVWKAAGMDMDHVEFRWASEDINNNADKYWNKMLEIARCFNIARIKKCCQIMGRLENNLTAAQILYPLMQCTDIFFLRADICQLGMDQRKVNMLARDYCEQVGIKNKPVILSHHMLYGLKKGQEKMSKSDPDSAIFMEDSAEDVVRKINKAYCPYKPEADIVKKDEAESMRAVEDDLKNPLLDYVEYIVMNSQKTPFVVNGVEYTDFAVFKADFLAMKIKEQDLKDAICKAINQLLEPVRQHFTNDPTAKELLEKVRQYKREASSATKSFRCLRLADLTGPVAAVFSPLPESPLIGVSMLVDTLNQLRAVPEGHQAVLYHADMSALVMNCFSAEKKIDNVKKNIKLWYNLFTRMLNVVAPNVMANVKVVYQSESMLSNPNDYWISVINVGRHFQLDTILNTAQENDSRAGIVVAALMHVGDVMGVGPSKILCSGSSAKLHQLAVEYIQAVAGQSQLSAPEVTVVPNGVTTLKNTTDLDRDLFVTDNPATGALKKVTKAFCEPGNVDVNPCLQLANEVGIKVTGSFMLIRGEKNGGNKEYTDFEQLKSDFASEAVHPGDLKDSVKKIMTSLLDTITKLSKSDKEVGTWISSINAYVKKMNKQKK